MEGRKEGSEYGRKEENRDGEEVITDFLPCLNANHLFQAGLHSLVLGYLAKKGLEVLGFSGTTSQ